MKLQYELPPSFCTAVVPPKPAMLPSPYPYPLCCPLAASLQAPPEWGIWLGMPGTLYIRALLLMVPVLVFCSVVTGVASLSEIGLSTGKIAARTIGLYLVTTLAGVAEGMIVTYTLKPLWYVEPVQPQVCVCVCVCVCV